MPAPLFRLRNNRKTRDKRCDRLESFDERSKDFGVVELGKVLGVANKKPRTKFWKVAQILDQGQEGACAGFGVGGELAAEPVMVEGITNEFCREKIYWEAQKIDGFEGGSYPEAEVASEGTSVIAAVKIAQRLGYISGYHWAFSLEETLYALSWLGPVVIGVNWYAGMGNTDSRGFVRPTGQRVGGHCVYLTGNEQKAGYVQFANSWGELWGKQGFGYMRHADLGKLLSQRGEACVFNGRKQP